VVAESALVRHQLLILNRGWDLRHPLSGAASTFRMYHYRYMVRLSLGGMKLGQSIYHSHCNHLNNSGTRELSKAYKLFMRACGKLVGEDFDQRIDTFFSFAAGAWMCLSVDWW
jgi:hypothetical protein